MHRALGDALHPLAEALRLEASCNAHCLGCTAGGNGGRNNANGVDLNRDFPDQFYTTAKAAEQQKHAQPETRALMDWITSMHFVLSANLHGGSLVASYPFDSSASDGDVYSKSPDDDVFRSISSTFASNHRKMWDQTQQCSDSQFPGGITNGADWYNVPGGMQDYNYLHSDCFEITIEMGCCKFPPARELETFWLDNQKALLAYAERVHTGVRGKVKDNVTMAGLDRPATIAVEGRSKEVHSGDKGFFWRLLLPGDYRLTVTAEGYKPATVPVSVKSTDPYVSPLRSPCSPRWMARYSGCRVYCWGGVHLMGGVSLTRIPPPPPLPPLALLPLQVRHRVPHRVPDARCQLEGGGVRAARRAAPGHDLRREHRPRVAGGQRRVRRARPAAEAQDAHVQRGAGPRL